MLFLPCGLICFLLVLFAVGLVVVVLALAVFFIIVCRTFDFLVVFALRPDLFLLLFEAEFVVALVIFFSLAVVFYCLSY